MPKGNKKRLYSSVIVHIFQKHWREGGSEVLFERSALVDAADAVGLALPKNLGDVVYSYKHRRDFPKEIAATAPKGMCWILDSAGPSKYRFRLVKIGGATFKPREGLLAVKIPDATPEIISAYALGDEQALLAKVRYNRLVDIFLGITTFSLQNHLRTQVKGIGQIEVDEIYVGLNRHGAHYIVPVQAKGKTDRLGPAQTLQDAAYCAAKFPDLICRPVSAQFMPDGVIALMELRVEDGNALIVEERHYRLVLAGEIDAATKRQYAALS